MFGEIPCISIHIILFTSLFLKIKSRICINKVLLIKHFLLFYLQCLYSVFDSHGY